MGDKDYMFLRMQEIFLKLVRLGIGHAELVQGSGFKVHGSVDWEALKALADAHGLSAVVLDGFVVKRWMLPYCSLSTERCSQKMTI